MGGECCIPESCLSLGEPECGTYDDGCDGQVHCGGCPAGDVCFDRHCCTPVTCEDVGRYSGTYDDGCGVTVECTVECCPDHPLGWPASCNARSHCEYAPEGGDEHRAEIYVPPGAFMMGGPEGEGGPDDERPVHQVDIGYGFFIGKYEITVALYGSCNAGGCTAPDVTEWPGPNGLNTSGNGRSDHPQNGLTWDQAGAYCAWMGGRLPSESEWEYAASGPVHRVYPWGDAPAPSCDPDNETAVFCQSGNEAGYGCGQGGTWPSGSKSAGASYVGALDMAGNVSEWVQDRLHTTYEGASRPDDGGAWEANPSGTNRVVRGGSFGNSAASMQAAERSADPPSNRNANRGARCLRPSEP